MINCFFFLHSHSTHNMLIFLSVSHDVLLVKIYKCLAFHGEWSNCHSVLRQMCSRCVNLLAPIGIDENSSLYGDTKSQSVKSHTGGSDIGNNNSWTKIQLIDLTSDS